VQESLTEE